MKLIAYLFFCLAIGATSLSQAELITDPSSPSMITDPEFKDLVWNRWVSGKFTVLALDEQKAGWVANNLVSLEKEVQLKWSYKASKKVEIRIIAVNDKTQLFKIFGLKEPRVEYLKDKEIIAIWTVFDNSPQVSLVPYLAQALLLDNYANLNMHDKNFWYIRGAGFLSGDASVARNKLKSLQTLKQEGIYFSDSLFKMTQDEYLKLSADRKLLFDAEATALCLFLRQEFGSLKLNGFLASGDVSKTYGFKNLEAFDKTFKRYLNDVGVGLSQNKMPDSYLKISSL